MKFIFLDVDGVLNCAKYILKYNEEIDDDMVERLKEIVDRTGAEIVLTSTWKIYLNTNLTAHHKSGQYLLDKLENFGLHLYDVTSDEGMDRGEGIIDFLAENDCDSFVILDDEVFDDYKEFELEKNLVRTNFYGDEAGLLDKHVKKAIEILENPDD